MNKIKEKFNEITGYECIDIMRLNQGYTNENYLINCEEGLFVLRIPGKGTENYIDRKQEGYNIRVIQNLGVTPPLVYFNDINGIMITKYLKSKDLFKNQLNEEAFFGMLLNVLDIVHRSGTTFCNEFDLRLEIDKYKMLYMKNGGYEPKLLADSREKLDEVVFNLETNYEKKLVPCHGDPNYGNYIITSQGKYLIDWEYSGMADEYFDIVNMVMTNNMSFSQEEQVLRIYEKIIGLNFDKKKYMHYKISTDYLWIYWHLLKLNEGQNREYNEFSWKNRLKRALINIEVLGEM